MTNQSLYRTAKMSHRKWQQFQLPQVLNFKHNFHKEIYKFPKKIIMKKCLKIVAISSELLVYCDDCLPKVLNNFCIITSGVVVEGRRALLNFKKSMLFSI